MNANSNPQFHSQNLNGLLEVVSKKLGMSPQQLRSDLEAGKFDNAMKSMSPSEAAKFQQAVQNPQMVEKLMSTPQAKALYQKLTGGK
jgi:hypothetical protein